MSKSFQRKLNFIRSTNQGCCCHKFVSSSQMLTLSNLSPRWGGGNFVSSLKHYSLISTSYKHRALYNYLAVLEAIFLLEKWHVILGLGLKEGYRVTDIV
jgi:hypothetical protein